MREAPPADFADLLHGLARLLRPQAVFKLISAKGYTAVSTREIALWAAVAAVTISRRFAGKENPPRQKA